VMFFLQGAGLANVVSPATEAVMSALPREKAGACSALNNTARQVAVAMGVAVLGSLLASVYRDRLAQPLAALPSGARATAGESIEGAHAVAERMGAAGRSLLGSADLAFVEAMRVAAGTGAVVALLGALLVLRAMPGRRPRENAAEGPVERVPEPEKGRR